MRKCSKCGKRKSEKAFFRGVGYKNGLRRQCKLCCQQRNNENRRTARRRCCAKCGCTKAGSAFGRTNSVTSWCLKCRREGARRWRAENPEAVRALDASRRKKPQQVRRMREYQRMYRLLVKYGITAEEYDAMFQQQRGRCAVCGDPPSSINTRCGVLHVDHDHKTRKVRGLVCFLCNTMLGSAKDDVRRLEAGKIYLQREC